MAQAEALNLADTPMQTVEDMFAVQTRNGLVMMRVEASVMERYDKDTIAYESFPKGIAIFGYSDEGLLETVIVSDDGRHITLKKGPGRPAPEEIWEAFGNVVIHNVLKQETMETDTIYWDNHAHEIWTDCYVKMYSPSGFMQGSGMRSDEMARNAILMNPFDNEFLLGADSTRVVVDSVNFIGPMLKK